MKTFNSSWHSHPFFPYYTRPFLVYKAKSLNQTVIHTVLNADQNAAQISQIKNSIKKQKQSKSKSEASSTHKLLPKSKD
jgi:hypothetical protein